MGQEWKLWGHANGQETDKENEQGYVSTRIELEGAGMVLVAGGDQAGVTPEQVQRMGNEIREAQEQGRTGQGREIRDRAALVPFFFATKNLCQRAEAL